MTAFILFWAIVLTASTILVVLIDVLGDDPTRSRRYTPPRSYHRDEFDQRNPR